MCCGRRYLFSIQRLWVRPSSIGSSAELTRGFRCRSYPIQAIQRSGHYGQYLVDDHVPGASIDPRMLQSLAHHSTIQFLTQFMTVLGTVALVFYTFPYLGIIFAPLAVLYWLVSAFYRKTSVEARRLDSLMRSSLYASYTETLTGLATIRAYGEQVSFCLSLLSRPV